VIEVIDNGTGIPPTMSGHLFELFHSTKGNRGRGWGLAVARKIVEEHEGSISVQSSPTEGTVFTIRLPVDNGGDGGCVEDARAGAIAAVVGICAPSFNN